MKQNKLQVTMVTIHKTFTSSTITNSSSNSNSNSNNIISILTSPLHIPPQQEVQLQQETKPTR
jgi:hypothetical protein